MNRILPALLVAVGLVLIVTTIASAASVQSVWTAQAPAGVPQVTISAVVTADSGATPILACKKSKDGEGKSCVAKVVALSQTVEPRPEPARVPRVLVNSPWREPVVISVQPRPPKIA